LKLSCDIGIGNCDCKKKHQLLIVDNFPAHPVLENLENMKLVFLPTNTASVLRPMDQGVIRSLKCHFHKLILLRMIDCTEKKQDDTATLLDAIRCVEKAWRRVMEKIIRNCFRHAGISPGVQEGVDATEKEDDVDDDDDDDDLPLSEWVRKIDCGVLGQYDYDAYATIYDDIVTAETQTDEEIVTEMRSKDGKEAEEPEEDEEDEEEELSCQFPL
jgi:hypothetical protein